MGKGGLIGDAVNVNLSGVWKLGEVYTERKNNGWSPIDIISTSQSTAPDTITLGTLSAGNTIVIFADKEGSGFGSPPSGFTETFINDDSNPRIAIYTKIATGTETTITGDWFFAVSLVIGGLVSVVGTTNLSTNGIAVAPSITLTGASLVFLWSASNNNDLVLSYPTDNWTQQQFISTAEASGVLYSKSYYDFFGTTGSKTITWDSISSNVKAVLISFTK